MTNFLLGFLIGFIMTVCFYELSDYQKHPIIEGEIIDKKGKKKMSGTIAGGKAAAKTNKKKYGEDFYGRIGAIGGKLGKTGEFFANRGLARIAGRKGGLKSKRGKK